MIVVPTPRKVTGEPTRDLLLLAREGVRGAIRVALHRATAGVEQRVREWAALERECCPFLTMRVTVTAADVALRIDGPLEAAGILEELLPAVA